MAEHRKCSLPKSEFTWRGGVQMKEEDKSNLRQDIERYRRRLKDIPDPNCGRISELRDKIKRKKFLTKEAISETAHRITLHFFRDP
jgi:hypothetical protein